MPQITMTAAEALQALDARMRLFRRWDAEAQRERNKAIDAEIKRFKAHCREVIKTPNLQLLEVARDWRTRKNVSPQLDLPGCPVSWVVKAENSKAPLTYRPERKIIISDVGMWSTLYELLTGNLDGPRDECD